MLEAFYNYAQTHFGSKIKFLRSDNALEFHDGYCQQFFVKMSIIHQSSCVDMPQQNARVERKHRHIFEIARALRFQAGLALKYWGECSMNVLHIINRLPSSIINNKTTFEMLFKSVPEYMHLKVFGCLAFATSPVLHHDKFKPRGVPCVFIGYPATQKGYRLLNLTDMTMFVSRDVVFYETIFPFQM